MVDILLQENSRYKMRINEQECICYFICISCSVSGTYRIETFR